MWHNNLIDIAVSFKQTSINFLVLHPKLQYVVKDYVLGINFTRLN
jgi:hypothetical protein